MVILSPLPKFGRCDIRNSSVKLLVGTVSIGRILLAFAIGRIELEFVKRWTDTFSMLHEEEEVKVKESQNSKMRIEILGWFKLLDNLYLYYFCEAQIFFFLQNMTFLAPHCFMKIVII